VHLKERYRKPNDVIVFIVSAATLAEARSTERPDEFAKNRPKFCPGDFFVKNNALSPGGVV
jgi:hypothetical protein